MSIFPLRQKSEAAVSEFIAKHSSNYYLKVLRPNGKKYVPMVGEYVSSEAAKKIFNGDFKGLRFEHCVPKQKYIHDQILYRIEHPEEDNPTSPQETSRNLYRQLWRIAIITECEDKLLGLRFEKEMPEGWVYEDETSPFARYEKAGIQISLWTDKDESDLKKTKTSKNHK